MTNKMGGGGLGATTTQTHKHKNTKKLLKTY